MNIINTSGIKNAMTQVAILFQPTGSCNCAVSIRILCVCMYLITVDGKNIRPQAMAAIIKFAGLRLIIDHCIHHTFDGIIVVVFKCGVRVYLWK